MRQICVFTVFLLLVSCENLKVKKTSSEAILKEELQTFSWNEVDVYPSFLVCDSLGTEQEKEKCFSNTLTSHILYYLDKQSIVVGRNIEDTISLQFQISNTGVLHLLDADIDSLILNEIPEIKHLLYNSLDSLPKIFPAIKRGQQVTTQFKMPIIISVK
ncbi:MAG: hypothetical protein ACK5MZ_06940 [Aestuariibaculum sp.]